MAHRQLDGSILLETDPHTLSSMFKERRSKQWRSGELLATVGQAAVSVMPSAEIPTNLLSSTALTGLTLRKAHLVIQYPFRSIS